MDYKSKLSYLPLSIVLLMPLCLAVDFFTLNSVTASWQDNKFPLKQAENILKETTCKTIVHYKNIPIFGFHDIVNTDDSSDLPPNRRQFDTDFSKQNIEKLLEYLVQNDYWFLTTEEFFDYFVKHTKTIPAKLKAKKPIMLTFDDGYKGIHKNLLPVLESLNQKYQNTISVVVFINPSLMATQDQDLLYMSCEDLQDGAQKGFFDVQSHGLTHHNMPELEVKDLIFDLSQAKKILKQCLKEVVPPSSVAKYLAYPHGDTNNRVIEYASKEYSGAFLYNHKLFEIDSKYNHTYKLSRFIISRKTQLNEVMKMLEENYQTETIALLRSTKTSEKFGIRN